MMARARRPRRLLAERSRLEWRDWANMGPDLVDEISGRLLSLDVTEYIRFRAVCRPWRDLTADPRSGPRFRPRNWAVLTIAPDAGPRRRLLNLATAASMGVELPALSTHCHVCAADGLLVLFHRETKTIRLLNPLSNDVTDFPALHIVNNGGDGIPSMTINRAGFDDSTSPPTLVLCLRDVMSKIVIAKPGDAHWTLVASGQASYPLHDPEGRVLFNSLLPRGGRCYFTSSEGSVYMLELRPLPRLVQIVDQRYMCTPDAHHRMPGMSFLVDDKGGGRMLMVRHWRNIDLFVGVMHEQVGMEMELLEVDIPGKRLVPMRSLSRHAVFVGFTHCVLICTDTFPSIVADSIYIGRVYQPIVNFSVYHLSERTTEPPYEFTLDRLSSHVPARPCNLDHYLVSYVDSVNSFSGKCINHARHY